MSLVPSRFQLQVEQAVVDELAKKPATLKDLEKRTNYNYYSLRNCVRELENQGLVITQGYKGRSQLWAVPDAATAQGRLPLIEDTINNTRLKVTMLLNLVGRENKMASVTAVTSLPRHITRLLHLATKLRVKEITADHNFTLNAIRMEMTNDVQQLRNIVNFYDQVLNNQRFWNPEFLKQFPNDEAFDKAVVLEAYEHYYPNSEPASVDKRDAEGS